MIDGRLDSKGPRGALTRRQAAGALAGLTALAAFGARPAAAGSARNVVLVHGAYADGSCWIDVIERLQAAGYRATAVQNSLASLAEDAAATRRTLAIQEGPTVLVGHSWGGAVISEAGNDPNVSALVYVAARAPDAGEDYAALAKTFPTPPAASGFVRSNGFTQFTEDSFLRDFANGVDPVRAKALYAVQGPIADGLFASKTTGAAWRSKPSWYAVSTQDRTTSPDLERFVAKRMKARTIELPAGHLSMISHSKEIADLIVAAANAG
ncbi:alpha/beta fold hydrolase [Hansschlegelia zhihuaiae]|uniref:Alpha/beta hydrolase n=1 Tax=Hansschlegelia zhihuaiae TaxID=405005 RepID=A0A4Q0MMQ5_9HYPH|nr:alpha/beta hydrolase [Hansschlegelia zhihuaiae]RXF75028.1 alpha/beta hydrolase [Hansschlegelia zhihuaiae]